MSTIIEITPDGAWPSFGGVLPHRAMAMTSSFGHLARASELSPEDLDRAVVSQESATALLARLSVISAPRSGAAGILAFFPHLALAEWLDAPLAVDLLADGEETRVRVMIEIAAGLRERVLPTVMLRAPIEELTSALEKFPALVAHMRLEVVSPRCVWLFAEESAPFSIPVELSERSISGIPEAAPADIDDAWDEISA